MNIIIPTLEIYKRIFLRYFLAILMPRGNNRVVFISIQSMKGEARREDVNKERGRKEY
jgi:hypothetical protein